MKRSSIAGFIIILTLLTLIGNVHATEERWIDPRFKVITLEEMQFTTRFVRLDDGKLMIVKGDSTLTSKNNGKTWSKPQVIYDGPAPGIPNASGQVL